LCQSQFVLVEFQLLMLLVDCRGKSGGGKSSIHSLLLRYYDPVKGRVTFDGQGTLRVTAFTRRNSETWIANQSFSLDIREFSVSSWRNIIGVVPQDPVLFTGTIASNIAFGNGGCTREQIENAAREANCEFVWGMPEGFDTPSRFYRFFKLLPYL
jgi:ABC-type multidrug transport system fused ATPase/permease subunit